MLVLLLGCEPSPSTGLGVTVPTAQNATAVPASRFVGPRDGHGVQGCGATDPVSLLVAGTYGWRVLSVAGDGVRLPDGRSVSLGDAKDLCVITELAGRWEEAAAVAQLRCGVRPETEVLVAMDVDARVGSVTALRGALGRGGVDRAHIRLLVRDDTPGAPVTRAVPADGRQPLTLARTNRGWAVLSSSADLPYEETDLSGAVAIVAEAGAPVVFALDPGLPWFSAASMLDALAGVGIEPSFAHPVRDGDPLPPAPAATFVGDARIALGDTVGVLAWPGEAWSSP